MLRKDEFPNAPKEKVESIKKKKIEILFIHASLLIKNAYYFLIPSTIN